MRRCRRLGSPSVTLRKQVHFPRRHLPLFNSPDPFRPIAFRMGRSISLAEVREDVGRFAASLPVRSRVPRQPLRGSLPVSRGLLRGNRARMDQSAAADESTGRGRSGRRYPRRQLPMSRCSGSGCLVRRAVRLLRFQWRSGGSRGHDRLHLREHWSSAGLPKQCWSLAGCTSRSSAAIRASLSGRFGDARPWIVATVPPQHMYGLEMSILLPALGDMAVHCGRPMFPQDVAGALADVPEPRVLVTTPVHLRVLSESGIRFPDTALIMSATAPLDAGKPRAPNARSTRRCSRYSDRRRRVPWRSEERPSTSRGISTKGQGSSPVSTVPCRGAVLPGRKSAGCRRAGLG